MGVFPDTIQALWFQAESYVETAGGTWKPCLGLSIAEVRIHALMMTTGEIWDVINGWRLTARYHNFEQESHEEYNKLVDAKEDSSGETKTGRVK